MHDVGSVLAALANAPALLLPLVREVPPEVLKRRPRPGKWSAHEHACHLAAVHPVMFARLERMLAEERPAIEPYEPPPEDQDGALLEVDLDEALERFVRDRGALVERLRGLTPEQWERTGEHGKYSRYSVFVMARHLALHDLLHAYRIEELALRKDWGEADAAAAPPAALEPRLLAALRPGEVHVLGPFAVPGLAARHVRVYLPQDFTPEEPRYLLLVFDGQNLFDDGPSHAGGWHLHEAVERLARAGRPAPIVVGIDHGGEERIGELSPFPVQGRPGRLGLLLDWVVGTLLPALAAAYPLHPPPVGAVVGGSSMGGLAALYAHFRHPEAFGGALAMSPSLWVGERGLFEELAARPDPPASRIYLDCGAREGRGTALPLAAALAAQLAGRGYGPDRLLWRPDPRGTHSEASWRRRLPKALRFMYR